MNMKAAYNSLITRVTKTYNKLTTKKYGRVLNIFKNSIQLFSNHDTGTQGAALSYYMTFSIAPMMIIIISIVGVIFGPQAVMGEIKDQVQSFVGAKGAEELQTVIAMAYKPGRTWIATTIAAVVLVIGATSVFDQLRLSLNTIWDLKPQAKKPVIKFFINRIFSFAMIVCLGFLMLVSLIIHAGLAGFNVIINRYLASFSVILLQIAENIISFGVTTVLFMLIYKFMSDAKPSWRSVWWGSVFTAFLFALGKNLITLYIGKTNLADTYGAAGSIVVALVWVYYSSQILFFGAEFTRALAIERGVKLDASAQKSNHEVGIDAKKVQDIHEPKKDS